MSATSVVITGIGCVVGSTAGADQLAAVLRARDSLTSEIDRSAGFHPAGSARRAVLANGIDLSTWVTAAAARRMSRPSKLGVAAARMALERAGLTTGDDARTAVVMSVAFPAVEVTEGLLRTVYGEGPEMASPFLFTESVANAAAAQIAIAAQAKGPNLTIVQGEAGALTAVGRGAAEVASGRADRALVGSIQEISPLLHALLDRFGALARANGDGAERARPFDRRRCGFVAAEGATVLTLESESSALARGASIVARVRGFGGAFDPTAPRNGWGTGESGLARALAALLERVEVARGDVRCIVSGASGSIAGDRLEALTLRRVWADAELPPIVAPKGAVGEYGGGFLAAAALIASDRRLPPTAGFDEMDPALQVTPYDGGELDASGPTLVTSLASGGAASWLLLEQP